jgi:hypothetical protein
MKARTALLLLSTWLIGTSGWAQQPVAANPAFVDSREECAALGGSWLALRGTWQASCQVPWAREECLRLHGAWAAIALAPNGGACVAQVSPPATARQCTAAGGTWGPPGSSMPFCQPGTVTAAVPIKAASDANKRCDSQGDCVYGCVYNGPPKPAGADVLGNCRPSNQIEGCYSMVEKGRLAGTICKQ